MLIAAPAIKDRFCTHFGKCDSVFLCEVDPATGEIERPRLVPRNASGCESLPNWLNEMAVQCVVAGGIGGGALQRLGEFGIAVSAGHNGKSPEDAVRHYLTNPQAELPNSCADHEHDHKHCRH